MWNCKDLMLPNGSIKSLSSIENTFDSIRGIIINIYLHSFWFGIVTNLCFRTEPYNPYLSNKTSKGKIYYLPQRFYPLMKFSCVIFHIFPHAVQVLFNATHCSRHNIYVLGNILNCLVQSPNRLTLLVNYPSGKMSTVNQLFLLKPAMTSSCHF